MNGKLASMLANRVLGVGEHKDSNDGEPARMPPIVESLLRSLGITPEAIAAYAEVLKDAVLEIRDNTRNTLELQKIMSSNQKILQEEMKVLQEEIQTVQDALNPSAAARVPIPAYQDGTPVEVTLIDVSEAMDPSKQN